VQRRDTLQKAGKTEEAKAAQVKVEAYHDKIYEKGYFRDSYNSSNLLWLFGLGWWEEVMEMLDDIGEMSPPYVERFLQMLVDREGIFEANLQTLEVWEGWTESGMETYFRKKYKRLKVLLKEATKLNEAIVCSV
jgi:hypothetical protein